METMTQTLTDFLLARIAEDEEAAYLRMAGGDPAAVAAVKQTTAGQFAAIGYSARRMGVHFVAQFPVALRAIAVEHADHPDYRPEWRP